nr:uroporphyrinogen-III synthase [Pseudoclavibacter sp. 13-3]
MHGWRVLVPRGGTEGERIAAEIAARGGVPVVAPLIRTVPPADASKLEQAVERLQAGDYDWVVLTSQRGVDALDDCGLAATTPRFRTACVGTTTAAAVQARLGLSPDLVPQQQSAHGLLDVFPRPGEAAADDRARLLLPHSAQAHATLDQGLRALGWQVDVVDAYRTIGVALSQQAIEDVRRGAIDAVLVTSGTVAQQVAIQFGASAAQTVLVSIGEQTTNDAEVLGLRIAATAREHSIPGMLAVLAELAAGRRRTGAATTISRAPSISRSSVTDQSATEGVTK